LPLYAAFTPFPFHPLLNRFGVTLGFLELTQDSGAGGWVSDMKKFLSVIFFLLLLFGAFLAGSWHSGRETTKGSTSTGRQISEEEDAADHAHTSDKGGGGLLKTEMAIEAGPANQDSGDTASMPSGTVRISVERQQIVGVRTAQVEKKPFSYQIRTFGRVAPDETRVYRLIAPLDGWIVEIFDNSTGSLVKKDEPLASFYSLDILTAQRNHISALAQVVSLKDDRTGPNPGPQSALARTRETYLKRTLDGLRSIGMPDVQIKELERTREFAEHILIAAPADSFVISRNVSPGQRFDKGTEWYRLADLSRIWILADLFESESQYFKPGARVQITLPYQRKAFQATVSKILPQFDAGSRTLKVRLETDNPGFILRPDMFVDVELPVSLPPCIFVPADAVLDSGLRKTVFVDHGNGFFEPRRVETGWRMGGQIEIVKGLRPGERIVVSGNFLIDSESRMELAAGGIYGLPSRDPVCGMDVDEKKAKASGRKSEYQGVTYFFCSDECRRRFEKSPAQYLRKESEVHSPAGHSAPTHPKTMGEGH
jgi:membrane fusion protein, copper/silver efflux system